MKLLVNTKLNLSLPTKDVQHFMDALATYNVSGKIYGTGVTQTITLSDQKITLDEDSMSELMQLLDGACEVPLILEYCGYGMTFEIYKKL